MSLSQALSEFLAIDFQTMRPPGFLRQQADQIRVTVENVDRGQGWRPNPECPGCASKRREVRLRRFGREVLQCLDCGLGYMDAFPVDTGDVYSDSGYLATQDANYLENVNYRKRRFAAERVAIIQRHLRVPLPGARLLDVGCGTGWFLEVAREQGFTVSGLEVGRDLAQLTSEKLGIPVHTVPLPDLPAGETFDVITLFDVLEHVPDPVAVLAALRARLNPGGIALIFVPNLESVGLQILGAESSLVMPAEHLFYFTPGSLRRLLERTPFEVLDFQTRGMDIPDAFALYRDELQKPEVAQFLAERGTLLQAVIDAAGCANHMRFVVGR